MNSGGNEGTGSTKILVTGANGFLGKKIMRMFSGDFEVVGTFHSKEDKNLIKMDICDAGEVKETLSRVRPDWVIHTAAITDVDLCDVDPELAWKTNCTGSFNIVNTCRDEQIRLLAISTDYVFSGRNSPYTEGAHPDPLGFYGLTKFIGENVILSLKKDAIVIRFTILYGYNDPCDKPSFTMDVIKKLSANKEVLIDDDRIKYPILVDDVALNIKRLIKSDESGVFHFSSKEPITRYQWACLIADVLGLRSNFIRKVKPRVFLNRPFNVQLVNTRNYGLRFKPVREGLELMKEQMGWGR